jgi:putative nucleotidyltransferase with HDIG domain
MQDISILIIDDNEQILKYLTELLVDEFTTILSATTGSEGLEIFNEEQPPILLIDVNLPDMSGLAILDQVKTLYPPSQCLMITGSDNSSTIKKALRGGACDYIVKPVKAFKLLHAIRQCLDKYNLMIEVDNYQHGLEDMVEEKTKKLSTILYKTVNALVKAMSARDPYTAQHQIRVTKLVTKIAQKLDYSTDRLKNIRLAAQLHDIGKIEVPQELLSKPGKLTTQQMSLIKEHSLSGYNIIKDIPFDVNIAEMVYQHHERLDGTGYPRGLTNDDILPESKIISVADVVEAIVTHRPYRAALPIEIAIDELTQFKGIKYSEEVVDATLEVINEHDDVSDIFNDE